MIIKHEDGYMPKSGEITGILKTLQDSQSS